MDEALAAALEQGATLITANRRLAAHLRHAYDTRQHARGERAWASPDILPLGAWLTRCWEEGAERLAERDGAPPPPLLSVAAREVLWERIIAASDAGRDLLDPAATAKLAVDAHVLRHEWGTDALSLEAIAAGAGAEGRAFAAWSREAAAWCDAQGWCDPVTLPDLLGDWLEAGLLEPPAILRVTGFDDMPPQTHRLLQRLRATGCDVSEYAPRLEPGVASVVAFDDPAAELEAAARWARKLLEEAGPDGVAPNSVGIVTPHLTAMRGEIERVFRDVLTPGCDLREPGPAEPVNLSLGESLDALPLVRDALALLTPWHAALPCETVAGLLRSPFLAGGDAERDGRARLDAVLRRERALELRWRDVLRAAEAERGSDGREGPLAPLLARKLRDLERLSRGQPASAPPSAWADHFTRVLRAVGWPGGDRGLNSAEHQAAEAWRELLDELGRLETVLPRLTWAEAHARLRWLAGERVFQPQREAAPVQVLGLLEAGGLRFDRLWLLGFDDATWPPAPRPNPFLPLALQRRLDLPHATPARELEFARRETGRLLAGAPRIVASHPRLREDRDVGRSPLLAHLPALQPQDVPRSPAPTARDAVHGARPPEPFRDGAVPVIAAGETHAGGVGLFTDQAACPFRAFAVHRLAAEALDAPEPGLSAMERGNIVHKALELLWERLGDHKTLCAQTDEQIAAVTADAADGAVAHFAERRPRAAPALLAIERERVAALLADFLEREKARAPFTVVAREARHDASFGGLTVRTRVDRIDRLEGSGGHVVIDYKTGDAWRSAWYGARPREPQLPLYCASADVPVAGVAFARVSRKHLDFQALADSADLLPGAMPFDKVKRPDGGEPYTSGTALIGEWRTILEGLGRGFREGVPVVDPSPPPENSGSPCARCHLPLLCRLADWAGAGGEEDEADEASGD